MLSDWPKYETIASFGVGRDNGPTAQRVTFIFDAEGICQRIISEEPEMEAHREGALEAVRDLNEVASS